MHEARFDINSRQEGLFVVKRYRWRPFHILELEEQHHTGAIVRVGFLLRASLGHACHKTKKSAGTSQLIVFCLLMFRTRLEEMPNRIRSVCPTRKLLQAIQEQWEVALTTRQLQYRIAEWLFTACPGNSGCNETALLAIQNSPIKTEALNSSEALITPTAQFHVSVLMPYEPISMCQLHSCHADNRTPKVGHSKNACNYFRF